MVSPSDKEYLETKLVKQGKKELKDEFLTLANWIKSEFGASPLNIIYDKVPVLNNQPRLQVIFEYKKDEDLFRDQDMPVNFNSEKQESITTKFKNIYSQEFDVENIFVVFSSFAPIARKEANSLIKGEEIEELKSELSYEHLWQISPYFSSATFFLYKDKHVQEAKMSNLILKWSKSYYQLLSKYDEFEYISEETFTIAIDSKENLDKNFGGSLFNYYR